MAVLRLPVEGEEQQRERLVRAAAEAVLPQELPEELGVPVAVAERPACFPQEEAAAAACQQPAQEGEEVQHQQVLRVRAGAGEPWERHHQPAARRWRDRPRASHSPCW